jgi:hypothetical protein
MEEPISATFRNCCIQHKTYLIEKSGTRDEQSNALL